MNEFIAHAMKKIDDHEDSIRRLIKKTKKLGFAIALLAGVSIYHTMKIADLQYEMFQIKKKLDEEPSTVINNFEAD